MKDYLEPAKKVIRCFLEEIEDHNSFRKNISPPKPALSFTVKDRMPVFDESEFDLFSDDNREKEDSYIWLYADVWEYRAFMQRPKPRPIPEYYNQKAWPLYQQWQNDEKKEIFDRKCKKIPIPSKRISLLKYLQKLALIVSERNEHRDVWVESLRSFIQFLRDDMHLEQKGPLEILFPSKESCKGMELRKNYFLKKIRNKIKQVEGRSILRRIENTVYPIDILAASEILINLAYAVLNGRPNSQRSAAEALGFAWLCHAVGCYRLVTREEIVFSTKIDAFKVPDLNKSKEFWKPTHLIGVNSLFGVIDVPISKTLYEFLLALPRDLGNTNIFSMHWESLLRTFHNKGVKPSERARNLGQITFLTFMSQPHEAIGHRPFLEKIISKSKKTVTHQAI